MKQVVKIFKPELVKKIDRIKQLKEEQYRLVSEKYKIELRLKEIECELSTQPKELVITDHAIDRYIERVMKVPRQVAKSILGSPKLLEKYRKAGGGKMVHPEYKGVVVVLVDYKVITCYNYFDPIKRLEDLSNYMNYFIDCLCENIISSDFREWRRKKYK